MAFFIDENGTYFTGDIEYERAQGRICTEVPERISRFHDWVDSKWIETEESLLRKEIEKQEEIDFAINEEYPTQKRSELQDTAIEALINGKAVPQEYLNYKTRIAEIKANIEENK